MFYNALRRENQARLEDATIRLTRVLEVYAQYRLIRDFSVNPFRNDKGKPRSMGATAMYKKVFGQTDTNKLSKLIELSDIRNNLSTIHSIGKGSPQEIDELKEQAEEFLEELWAELDDNLKKLINMGDNISAFNFDKNVLIFKTE